MNGEPENDEDCVLVSVKDFTFKLSTAENDFNESKRCLFATMIWSGAKVLSDFLVTPDVAQRIQNKCVIEFGAAAGLPSLICNHIGSDRVCASDFPSPAVVANLISNIDRNKACAKHNIGVVPHKWGEDVVDLLAFNGGLQYDFVLAAECLWHHSFHPALIQSVCAVLRPGGTAFVTFSHHVPGCEQDDLAFFEEAAKSGLRVVHQRACSAPHMWKETDTTIHLYELVKDA